MVKLPNNIPSHIAEELYRFIRILNEDGSFTNLKIVLFGSFQNGSFHTWSDIDIAVVGNWHTDNMNERVAYLQRIAIDGGCNRVHPIGITEIELREGRNHDFYKKIAAGMVVFNRL